MTLNAPVDLHRSVSHFELKSSTSFYINHSSRSSFSTSCASTALTSLAKELQQTAACKFTVKCALYAPLRQGAKPQMGWKALSPGRRGAAAGADLGKIREYHTNRNRERTEKGSVPCFLYPQRRSFSAPKQTKGRSKLKETTFLVNISKKRSVKLAVWTWQKGIDFCANG